MSHEFIKNQRDRNVLSHKIKVSFQCRILHYSPIKEIPVISVWFSFSFNSVLRIYLLIAFVCVTLFLRNLKDKWCLKHYFTVYLFTFIKA